MTVTPGLKDTDPKAGFRRDACHFSDDRLTVASKVDFVHELLGREMAEVRMFLDPIERFAGSVPAAGRQSPETARSLDAIAGDKAARERYLTFARDADDPAVRVRMMAVERNLGWLTVDEERSEYAQMVADRMARDAVGVADVELACSLDRKREMGRELLERQLPEGQADKVAGAAVLACHGSVAGHARVLRALVATHIFLLHRAIADANVVGVVADGIVRMPGSEAQVRALDTLAGHRLSDPVSLTILANLFPKTRSLQVQRAIAGILIRADYQLLAGIDLAKTLLTHRVKSPDGKDLIDRPASERLRILRERLPETLRVPHTVAEDAQTAERFLDDALAHGHEGVMVKALEAPYEAGRRGAGWLKVKRAHTLDLVVLAAEWGHGRRQGWLSNLHLGARDPNDGFVMLGKTFKGMTDEMLVWQTARLLELETSREGIVVHVRPEVVVEVAFDGLQASPRYPGGMALRFARVKGYRHDKRPEAADTIDTVRAIFEGSAAG